MPALSAHTARETAAPPAVRRVRLKVIVHRNVGTPREIYDDVTSVLEISDEINETISAISFFDNNQNKWQDVKLDHTFEHIEIRRKP